MTRSLKRLSVSFTVLLLGIAGCGSDSSKTKTTTEQACTDEAQAQCEKRDSCSNGTGITRAFGTMQTCLAREALACTNALGAPNTGNNPALVEQCAMALATSSCASFFDNEPPAVCAPMGPAATGGACVFPGQCGSAYCSGTRDALCGVCAASPAAGASCASSPCGHGQVCVAATELCQDFGDLGTACDATHPCGNGFTCVGAVASTSTPGTCEAAVTQMGAPCGGTQPGCEDALGLFCGGPTGSKTCMPISYVADGEPCGNLSPTSRAECVAGGCYTDMGLAAFEEFGTCKADAADGRACDDVFGPACQPPARCVVTGSSTAGVCTLPTGTSCG